MSGKPLPPLLTDEDAERFIEEADLSEYDLSKGRWVRFDVTDGSLREIASVDLVPADMETARRQASREGVSVNSYLGRLLHDSLERLAS